MAKRKMTFPKTKTANSVLKQLGVSAAFIMASADVGALGLGALEVQSNLDQPLNGTIELRTSASDDVNSVSASIASKEDFEGLGIDYPSYLENIRLSVEDGASGNKLLRVNSNGIIIKEPFIHFLVRVDWSGGSFLREYTALIDPPVYAAAAPKALSEPRAVGTDQSYQASSEVEVEDLVDENYDEVVANDPPVTEEYVAEEDLTVEEPIVEEPIVEEEAIAEEEPLIEDDFYETPEQEGVDQPALPDGARYGPVAGGESLSLIAQELQRQFPDLSIYAIMKVLFEENPDAFISNNINGLIKGVMLDVGDLSKIRAVDVEESRRFFREQVAEWDPSVLASSGDDSLNVGQDEYSFNDDIFDEDGGSSSEATDESFQIGASDETDNFVSSDQGGNRDGEVLALRQQLSELQSSLASSELENRELTERISMLEGQISDLNRLSELSVENADLATLESTLAEQNNEDALATEDDTSALDEFLTDSTDELLTDSTDELLDDSSLGLDDAAADDSLSAVDDSVLDDGTLVDDGSLDSEDSIIDESTSSVDEFLTDSESALDELVDDSGELVGSVEDAGDGIETLETTEPVAPTVAPVESKSFFDKAKDMFFEGGLWKILAGLVGLLVAGLGLLLFRRRRADEEFEISMLSIESNSQNMDSMRSDSHSQSTQSASISTSVASVGADAVPDKETSFLTVYSDSDAVVQADEVDPVAEADVYIAYGRDEQAEEVLLDGIASQPDRLDIKQKLLGLYHKNENAEGFERLAEELYSQPELLTSEVWAEVSEMGKEVAPNNPLFSLSIDDLSAAEAIDSTLSEDEGKSEESSAETAAASDDSVDFEEAIQDSTQEVAEDVAELTKDSDDSSVHLINFDDGRSQVSELDEVEIDALDLDAVDAEKDVIDFADSTLNDVADSDGDEKLVEIDLDESLADEVELNEQDSVDDIEGQSIGSVQEVSDLEIDPDYDEARTQYELAKVFVDLGDEDGAKKILNELVANDDNDEAVLSDARELLESINS